MPRRGRRNPSQSPPTPSKPARAAFDHLDGNAGGGGGGGGAAAAIALVAVGGGGGAVLGSGSTAMFVRVRKAEQSHLEEPCAKKAKGRAKPRAPLAPAAEYARKARHARVHELQASVETLQALERGGADEEFYEPPCAAGVLVLRNAKGMPPGSVLKRFASARFVLEPSEECDGSYDLYVSSCTTRAHGSVVGVLMWSIGNFVAAYGDMFDSCPGSSLWTTTGRQLEPDAIMQLWADRFPGQPPQRPQNCSAAYPAEWHKRLNPALVVEFEVSHRSPRMMRETAAEYLAQPFAGHVVMMKVWQRRKNGTYAAAAVHYRRVPASRRRLAHAVVVQAISFGTAPLRAQPLAAFQRAPPAGMLFMPPVPANGWTDRVAPAGVAMQDPDLAIPAADIFAHLPPGVGAPAVRQGHQHVRFSLQRIRDNLERLLE